MSGSPLNGPRLARLLELPLRHPGGAALGALASLVLAGLLIASLDFQTEVTEVLDGPAARVLADAGQAFGLKERAYLLVRAPRPDEALLVRCGERLARELRASPRIARVELGPPIPKDEQLRRLLYPYGPLWIEPGRLGELEALFAAPGLEAQLQKQAERLALLGLGETDRWVELDPLELHRGLVRRFASLRAGRGFASDSRHALSADGRALLVDVVTTQGASGLGFARAVTEDIERARAALLREPWAAGVEVLATGGHLFAEESERVIREDLTRGLGLSLLLALLLLSWGLRLAPWRVLLLLLPTLWGLAAGVALFALLRRELTVLSLGCASVLVGLGVDFTIHIAAAGRAARARGHAPRVAARRALRRTRGALALAALTSIAAFLAFQRAHQRFLADMGLVTACGLVACLIGSLLFVPPLLAAVLEREPLVVPGTRLLGVGGLVGFARRAPRVALAATMILTVTAAFLVSERPPRFSGDLRELYASESEPLRGQEAIAATFGGGVDPLLLLVRAADEEALLAACHRLEPTLLEWVRAGRLSARASPAALVPSRADQDQVLALLARHDPRRARAELEAACVASGFDPAGLAPALAGWEAAVASRAPLGLEALRAAGLGELVDRFVRSDGQGALGLVLLTPPSGLWEQEARAALARDVDALLRATGVQARLSGLPYLTAETTGRIALDFAQVSVLTALAVVAVLLLHFRGLGRAALALLPAALGTLWTAGAFALLGVSYNLMNLGVLPMVLALGVDDGIHVVHQRLRGQGDEEADHATEVGVVLTSLTTLVAFGALAFSRNKGIASVGALTLLGMGGCLLASVIVLPALLELQDDRRRKLPE
ncbi:MAG: MMPL family transporter [Planctomycetota bacterium]